MVDKIKVLKIKNLKLKLDYMKYQLQHKLLYKKTYRILGLKCLHNY
nr:MAG TPA: hypothetical protein [Caudoviricetes sp.]